MATKIKSAEKHSRSDAEKTRRGASPLSRVAPQPVDGLLGVQQAVGNLAIQRLMRSGALQPQLRIPYPGPAAVAPASGDPVQRKCKGCEEEEEALQRKAEPVQRIEEDEEEPLQGKFTPSVTSAQRQGGGGETANPNGLPGPLKAGLEGLSSMDLSGVRVHYNASRPAQLNALAYTQGQDIHVGPGQEKHLPHEGWHAVQQMQGGVKPTMQAKGVSINDDAGLEREADVMGAKALQMTRVSIKQRSSHHQGAASLQRKVETKGNPEVPGEAIRASGDKVRLNSLSTDPLEREADEIGDAVVQRKEECSCGGTCEECQRREQMSSVIQRKNGDEQENVSLPAEDQVCLPEEPDICEVQEPVDEQDQVCLLEEPDICEMTEETEVLNETPAAVDPLEITTGNIDDAIDIMWKTYQILIRMRRDALDPLLVIIEKEAEPSPGFLKDLFLAALTAGLLGPTGLIGGTIANLIIDAGEGSSTKAQIGNDAITNALNSAIKTSLTAAYDKTIGKLGKGEEEIDKETRKIFFLTQKTFLSDESDKVEVYFLNNAQTYRDIEKTKRGSGIKALKSLQKSVLETFEYAARIQQEKSLDAWLVYMSRKELGEYRGPQAWEEKLQVVGADLRKIMGEDGFVRVYATNGVLALWIEINPDYPTERVTIKKAWLKGLNPRLRKELEGRPIRLMDFPIAAYYDPSWGFGFSVGMNTRGHTWYSTTGAKSPRTMLHYLTHKARPELYAHIRKQEDYDEISNQELKDGAHEGAKVIIYQELGPWSLKVDGIKLEPGKGES